MGFLPKLAKNILYCIFLNNYTNNFIIGLKQMSNWTYNITVHIKMLLDN